MLKDRKNFYINLIKQSESLIDVCRKANIVPTTGNYNTLKKIIKEEKIDISHFKRFSQNINTKKRNISEYLNNNHQISSYKLKNRLLNEGYKKYVCEKCGNTEWFGKPIPLELHHINGDNTDNRLENLQILCPNCHACTDNYGGKNQHININKKYCQRCGKELNENQTKFCSIDCAYKNRTIKISKEKCDEIVLKYNTNDSILKIAKDTNHCVKTIKRILNENGFNTNKNKLVKEKNDKKIPLILETLKKTKSFSKTGKEFGVSDNAIRHLLSKRGYPTHIKDLLEYMK